MADVAIINKVDTAPQEGIDRVRSNIRKYAPRAEIIMAESPVLVNEPEKIAGSRVLVVEDGPTVTHGEMAFGAGMVAANTFGALEIIDPRPFAVGAIKETYERYPAIGPVLPAMGYSAQQIRNLEETINRSDCDLVLFATPIQLKRILSIEKPAIRVRYEYRDHGSPTLEDVLNQKIDELSLVAD